MSLLIFAKGDLLIVISTFAGFVHTYWKQDYESKPMLCEPKAYHITPEIIIATHGAPVCISWFGLTIAIGGLKLTL